MNSTKSGRGYGFLIFATLFAVAAGLLVASVARAGTGSPDLILIHDPSGYSTTFTSSHYMQVAEFEIVNVGMRNAQIDLMNVDFVHSGMVNTSNRRVRFYQEDGGTDIQLGGYLFAAGDPYAQTEIEDDRFRDVIVPAGESRLFKITVDTSDMSMADAPALIIASMEPGDIVWSYAEEEGLTQVMGIPFLFNAVAM